jgi:hypothetical protein
MAHNGQRRQSPLAILAALTLRAVSRLTLRQSEGLTKKHGTKTHRSWRKLHIGMDADTGQIAAVTLTAKEIDDGSQVGPLLDHVAALVAACEWALARDPSNLSKIRQLSRRSAPGPHANFQINPLAARVARSLSWVHTRPRRR